MSAIDAPLIFGVLAFAATVAALQLRWRTRVMREMRLPPEAADDGSFTMSASRAAVDRVLHGVVATLAGLVLLGMIARGPLLESVIAIAIGHGLPLLYSGIRDWSRVSRHAVRVSDAGIARASATDGSTGFIAWKDVFAVKAVKVGGGLVHSGECDVVVESRTFQAVLVPHGLRGYGELLAAIADHVPRPYWDPQFRSFYDRASADRLIAANPTPLPTPPAD
jgi:hypothetical protein